MKHRRLVIGATIGLAFGLTVFGILWALSLSKNSPGGPAENRMWLGLFASLWGMPFAGLLDLLAPDQGRSIKTVVVVLAANWMILGAIVGAVLDWRAGRSLVAYR